jgi:hypothetical protein
MLMALLLPIRASCGSIVIREGTSSAVRRSSGNNLAVASDSIAAVPGRLTEGCREGSLSDGLILTATSLMLHPREPVAESGLAFGEGSGLRG